MNKEQVLTWMMTLGKDWVSIDEVHEAHATRVLDVTLWDWLDLWTRQGYLDYERREIDMEGIPLYKLNFYKLTGSEQYRLTKRAIEALND